ncbi:hypothetical protein BIV57_15140 [Mangrovactinospora gilvigrisea]|uniref:FAD-binding PCMH-type domain-containing protein n=1 Tax=Mangrovactinospora gilvigrisea TaxID=1428644 RepID=A0A1J7BDH9_9ACTN|nr:FAD-binding protein [Mangrovactinospora gilvigrisea]OIV36637.1 hypothetical protein BIV57_15140 [Mangrovactinospora gilvigrisea]
MTGADPQRPRDRRRPVVLRPADAGEAVEAVLEGAKARGRLRIAGAGTAAEWGGMRPDPDAAVLSTERLRGVVDHQPDDMVLVVRAGTPLAELAPELAAHGQRLALDPARAEEGATVGGLLATADAGPLRQLHGGPRDLVLGVTVVLADGTAARSGGRVIKNVAGYDLAKLLSGSLGTLGLVVELAVRLHPVPEATATWAVPCADRAALAVARRAEAAGAEPAAMQWADLGDGSEPRLLLRFEGGEGALTERLAAVAEVLPAGRALRGDAEDAAWAATAAAVRGGAFRVTAAPGAFPLVDAVPAGTVRVREVGGGVETVAPGETSVVDAYRAAADPVGRTLMPHRRSAGGVVLADPATLPVRTALKRALDPEGRLPGPLSSPARFPAPPAGRADT